MNHEISMMGMCCRGDVMDGGDRVESMFVFTMAVARGNRVARVSLYGSLRPLLGKHYSL